ncbi:MAG: Holliday junction resolvase RuvX [Clostridia bacterium]|nr:Holliday junction resolvase RuvX [Clostridia bacterium]
MDLTHGKYLSVDYGDVRTGLATCDPSGLIAEGLETVRCGGMKNTAVYCAALAKKLGCKKIIVGLPKNMDGTEGGRAETVGAFIALLGEQTDLPIDTMDERMTTMIAYRYLGASEVYGKKRKGAVDTLSAEIILQDYLDKERKGSL